MTTESVPPTGTEGSIPPIMPPQPISTANNGHMQTNTPTSSASTNDVASNTNSAPPASVPDVVPDKPAGAPPGGRPPQVFSDEPLNPDTVIKTENLYIFTEPKNDRDRLIAQSHLFGNFLTIHAKRFLKMEPQSILDFGCGDGQLSLVLKRIYPKAKLVGIDSDPRAIETAQKLLQRAAGISGTIDYKVGDENSLPEGQFDLIYVSMVLLHSRDAKHLITNLMHKLTPRGFLWIKDADATSMSNAVTHPAWIYMSEKLEQAMKAIGVQPTIGAQLPTILKEMGFSEVRTEYEVYRLGEANANSQIATSIFLSAFMNAVPLMSKVLQIPIAELRAKHEELSKDALKLKGTPRFINVIVQRPKELPAMPAHATVEPAVMPTDSPKANLPADAPSGAPPIPPTDSKG